MFRDLINKSHESVGGCAGLVTIVCNRLGLDIPKDWDGRDDFLFVRISRGMQQKGDVVHIQSMAGNHHVAVMVSKTDLLQSTSKRGVHKLGLNHPWLDGRILGFYRHVKQGEPIDNTGIMVSPVEMSKLMSVAHDDDGQSLAMISLAVLSMVVSYGVSGALAGGAYASTASFWGAAASFATMTVGGMIINNALAPADNDNAADDSPTYGWSVGANTASVGIAIPVFYGNCPSWPNVINQWIEIDSDGDQWSHNLLSIAEGETNNVPTTSEVYVDDQPITTIVDDNYSIETTTGDGSPTAALTNHEYLHQMSSINKELSESKLSSVLLHFNGDDASTLIIDDATGVADDPNYSGDTDRTSTWTCKNGAALSTAHPFITGTGQANLNLETYTSYISCDQPLAFVGFMYRFDFECRFRQDSLTNSIIAYQSVNYSGSTWYWNICYYGGELVYQLFKETSGVYYTYVNVSIPVTLTIDTWHHIRVARDTDFSESDVPISSVIIMYLDGTQVGNTSYFDDVTDGGFGKIYADPTEAKQFVGTGYYYNGSGKTTLYGNCELDELRMSPFCQLYDSISSYEIIDGYNSLLHLDGTHGSTTITDDATGLDISSNWTCANTAVLSTTHPQSGTANLWLETDGDYVSCDEPKAFVGFFDQFEVDFYFRQDALTNSGIAGQTGYYNGDTYSWGLFYISGSLVFQMYKHLSGLAILYANAAVAVSLSINTWYHIKVVRASEYDTNRSLSSSEIQFYLNGSLVDTVQFLNLTGPGERILNVTTPAIQYIGKATYYTGGTFTDYYGNCELDEFGMSAYYMHDSFVLPTNPLANEGEQTYLTKCEIDSFKITISFPSGLYKVFIEKDWDDTGSYYSRNVDFWISYRKEGTTVWHRYWVNINKNQTTPVYKQWTFTPEDGRGKYEIRVARLQWRINDRDSYTDVSTCMFLYIDNILHESLMYPYLQLLSLSIKAYDKYSGRIPSIKVINNRTSVSIPNFNGSGTQTINPTNNAYCSFDLLTNRVYGAGLDAEILTKGLTDYWDDWVAWCDGLVDGNKRCQINMVFDEAFNLDDALSHVEACGRAQLMTRGSGLMPLVDKPVDGPINLYIPENIKPGTNTVTYIRQSEIADKVEISYTDKDEEWVEQTVHAQSSNFNTLTRTPNVVRLTLRGVNNRDQAQREAILRQQMNEATDMSDNFQTGLEGILDLPGNVIEHGKGTMMFTGRLQKDTNRLNEYTGTTVYLDQEINLDSTIYSGNCILQVRDSDDTISQYTVSGPFDTDTRTVTVSASGTFEYLSPWKIMRTSGDVHQFRINSVRQSSQMDVEVSGLKYDADAYYHANYGGGETAI